MSPRPPRCTSMCCQSTATVASREKAPSSCGVTCSTSAACRAFAGRCWSVRTSWCPSTSKLALRRRARQPSLCPTCTSKRWSTCSVGKRMHGETAAASLDLHPLPLKWTRRQTGRPGGRQHRPGVKTHPSGLDPLLHPKREQMFSDINEYILSVFVSSCLYINWLFLW